MSDFQRARRPEQVAERRTAILQTARALLSDQRLADISLRELSAQVGLAKSNVLRYFESREAIFLAVLDQEWGTWAEQLEQEPLPPHADEAEVARVLALTLTSAPLLCELWGALGSVLEHNIDVDTARTFKTTSAAHADKVEAWLTRSLPALDPQAARKVAAVTALLAGALSAYRRPSPVVATITAEFGGFSAAPFEDNLQQAMHSLLLGQTALASPGR